MKTALLVLALSIPALACGPVSHRSAILEVARKIRDVGCTGARVGCRLADRACAATGGPDVLGDDELEAAVDAELEAE